jgi:hypothetical protein
MKSSDSSLPGLWLIVQIGFAGKGCLLDLDRHPGVDPPAFHAGLTEQLTERLRPRRALTEQAFRHLAPQTAAWHARRPFTGIA